MNITNYELLNALVDSTSTMNNWITNCRTCEECEKCALFPCIAIKHTDKNKVIINSWILNCRKCEECKGCALFPCASVKQTNNKIYMEDSNNIGLKNFCPHCGQELMKSTIEGYAFQCVNCDEDFMAFEVISENIMKQREKAAEKYALDCQSGEGYPSPTYDSYDAKEMRECAFNAGARWQSKQSPWIRVKDRLPEENENVIIMCKHGAIFNGTYCNSVWFCMDGYVNDTYKGNPTYSSMCSIPPMWKPTHWMPTPKTNN